MISYQTIHQTDKSVKTKSWETEEWVRMNEKDGWKLNFLDDDMALKWVKERFTGSDVLWAWEYMHRGVLRADFLRYLLPLLEGGVYSDVDVSWLSQVAIYILIGRRLAHFAQLNSGDVCRSNTSTCPLQTVQIGASHYRKAPQLSLASMSMSTLIPHGQTIGQDRLVSVNGPWLPHPTIPSLSTRLDV